MDPWLVDAQKVRATAAATLSDAKKLKAESKKAKKGREGLRSRRNDLLSQAAIVVTHAALAGYDQDLDWCNRIAGAFQEKWTATSQANCRAGLIRVITGGAASTDGIRVGARAVDRVLAEHRERMATLPDAERRTAIEELFSKGVTAVAGDNRPTLPAARCQRRSKTEPLMVWVTG
jgi:hypothetical protein